MTGIYLDEDEIDRRLAEARLLIASATYEALCAGGRVGGYGPASAFHFHVLDRRDAARVLHAIERRMRVGRITGARAAAPPVGVGVRQIVDGT